MSPPLHSSTQALQDAEHSINTSDPNSQISAHTAAAPNVHSDPVAEATDIPEDTLRGQNYAQEPMSDLPDVTTMPAANGITAEAQSAAEASDGASAEASGAAQQSANQGPDSMPASAQSAADTDMTSAAGHPPQMAVLASLDQVRSLTDASALPICLVCQLCCPHTLTLCCFRATDCLHACM